MSDEKLRKRFDEGHNIDDLENEDEPTIIEMVKEYFGGSNSGYVEPQAIKTRDLYYSKYNLFRKNRCAH